MWRTCTARRRFKGERVTRSSVPKAKRKIGQEQGWGRDPSPSQAAVGSVHMHVWGMTLQALESICTTWGLHFKDFLS